MKVEISGGFTITIKRRRKRQEAIEETEVESNTEVFRPGFQPNPDDGEEEVDDDGVARG